MRIDATTYAEAYDNFHWNLPERFNIAHACCLRHATGNLRDAPALIFLHEDGTRDVYSFGLLATFAARFCNALKSADIGPGDIVAVHLPQCPEAVIAHLGIQMAGAIALPLFGKFGPDAMTFRLRDAGPKSLVSTLDGLLPIEKQLHGGSSIPQLLCVDGDGPAGARSFWATLEAASPQADAHPTGINDPAFLMYTSGTTGDPKGVLHAQRVLIGHLPGMILPHEGFPVSGDKFWTPADWAWAGGLFDALLPALYFGVPVVGSKQRFDPEHAMALMAVEAVRNAFIPPTALRLMRGADVRPPEHFCIRTIGTGGESLGEDMIAWGHKTFGLTLNEFYGQTEANLVIGNSSALFDVRAGSMGRAIPGHDVAVVDDNGNLLGEGEEGIVAVRRPNPVMFLEYWNNPEATRSKFAGDWCLLGDVARRDADGYFWFRGRDDDIIMSAGYRIGPSEIEDCLISHPDVTLAGVIGAPDSVRGEIVVAYVVLRDGVTSSPELEDALQQWVRNRLGAHQYPRHVRVVDELPTTLTGKIQRNRLRALEKVRTSK
ncbi:MAG: AMP-binding protein [Pseudomonadota bacterium]